MADRLRTDELKKGDWVRNKHPMRGFPWQQVFDTRKVDEGVVCPIYRIEFEGSGMDLLANADRVFEVEHTEPEEMRQFKSGLALPPGY